MGTRNNINQQYELYIFDFDGTIVHLNVNWDALKRELSKFCQLKYNILKSFTPLNSHLNEVIHCAGTNSKESLFSIISKYELEGLNGASANNKMINFIKSLINKKIAVFSSNCRKVITASLECLDILNKVDKIISKEDVLNQKPDPEGLNILFDHFRISHVKCLFVGNSEDDFEAGRKARVKTIHYDEL